MGAESLVITHAWKTQDGSHYVRAKVPATGTLATFAVPRPFEIGSTVHARRVGYHWQFAGHAEARP